MSRFLVQYSVTDVHGGARNEEAWNFVWNTLFYKHRTEIAGDRYTHSGNDVNTGQRHWEH